MDDGDVEADFGGEFYRWTCPSCGEVNEEETDPRGTEVACDTCDWKGRCAS